MFNINNLDRKIWGVKSLYGIYKILKKINIEYNEYINFLNINLVSNKREFDDTYSELKRVLIESQCITKREVKLLHCIGKQFFLEAYQRNIISGKEADEYALGLKKEIKIKKKML